MFTNRDHLGKEEGGEKRHGLICKRKCMLTRYKKKKKKDSFVPYGYRSYTPPHQNAQVSSIRGRTQAAPPASPRFVGMSTSYGMERLPNFSNTSQLLILVANYQEKS